MHMVRKGKAMLNRTRLAQVRVKRTLNEIETVRAHLPEDVLRVLALEVVQRVAAHPRRAIAEDTGPSEEEIARLCTALLSSDPDDGLHFMERVMASGVDHEDACLRYLAVAARKLGDWWDRDRVSFMQVTVAVGRIYAILRSLRHAPQPRPGLHGKSAVFAAVPDEDHTLGVTMAADMFRDKGWDIQLLVGLTHEDLIERLIASEGFLIGLSASSERSLPALIRAMVAIRICCPTAKVLICGNIASGSVDLLGLSGADAVAASFADALSELDRLHRVALSR